MIATISQPRYLPSLNYLQRACNSTLFVAFDIVQRQARAYENRNRLLLPEPKWLTIPIGSSSRALICDSRIDGSAWVEAHRRAIADNYRGAPFFEFDLIDTYFSPYLDTANPASSAFATATVAALRCICAELALPINLAFASEVADANTLAAVGPSKLRNLCRVLGASTYISGPNGRGYGVSEAFAGSGCEVLFDATTPRTYTQHNHPHEFVPHMGFFDALFNMGREWVREVVLTPPSLIP